MWPAGLGSEEAALLGVGACESETSQAGEAFQTSPLCLLPPGGAFSGDGRWGNRPSVLAMNHGQTGFEWLSVLERGESV